MVPATPWSASVTSATSSASRLVADALIDASGVRRSWLTAASSAVRRSLAWASSLGRGRLGLERAGLATARRGGQ